jgi:hypothetical protein
MHYSRLSGWQRVTRCRPRQRSPGPSAEVSLLGRAIRQTTEFPSNISHGPDRTGSKPAVSSGACGMQPGDAGLDHGSCGRHAKLTQAMQEGHPMVASK